MLFTRRGATIGASVVGVAVIVALVFNRPSSHWHLLELPAVPQSGWHAASCPRRQSSDLGYEARPPTYDRAFVLRLFSTIDQLGLGPRSDLNDKRDAVTQAAFVYLSNDHHTWWICGGAKKFAGQLDPPARTPAALAQRWTQMSTRLAWGSASGDPCGQLAALNPADDGWQTQCVELVDFAAWNQLMFDTFRLTGQIFSASATCAKLALDAQKARSIVTTLAKGTPSGTPTLSSTEAIRLVSNAISLRDVERHYRGCTAAVDYLTGVAP